jgi:hypothetical protein
VLVWLATEVVCSSYSNSCCLHDGSMACACRHCTSADVVTETWRGFVDHVPDSSACDAVFTFDLGLSVVLIGVSCITCLCCSDACRWLHAVTVAPLLA